jgi:hypothetical protein
MRNAVIVGPTFANQQIINRLCLGGRAVHQAGAEPAELRSADQCTLNAFAYLSLAGRAGALTRETPGRILLAAGVSAETVGFRHSSGHDGSGALAKTLSTCQIRSLGWMRRLRRQTNAMAASPDHAIALSLFLIPSHSTKK